MAYGTVSADQITTSVSGYSLGAGNSSLMKNKIINGAMVIDQRNAGASVTPVNSGYTLDRWQFLLAQASKLTCQQNAGSVTPPTGFTNYLGITSSSAYTVGAAETFALAQSIEGFNASDLGWGTASAKTVTLSFQVYSSLTGTFGGSLTNSAYTRSYPFSYSIPVANTWTTVSVTIAGDTTGTWLGTNNTAIRVAFGLGCGSSVSGTAGSWSATAYTSATGATSVVGTSGATFYITGVQLEVGSSATGFEYRQYGQELALCQRYYRKTDITTYSEGTIFGYGNTSQVIGQSSPYPVTMRASATATYGGSWTLLNASQSMVGSQSNYFTYINVTSTGYAYQYPNANGYITFSAEL
jgi:hypothetical protein